MIFFMKCAFHVLGNFLTNSISMNFTNLLNEDK